MNTDPSNSELEDFWRASELSYLKIADFAARSASYVAEAGMVDALATSAAPVPLPLRRDRLQKTFEQRRSHRTFASRSLSEKSLGQVLGCLRGTAGVDRLYPGAGGLGAVEVYPLLHNVASPLGRIAARYLPETHKLAPLPGELPGMERLDELCSLEGNTPALIVIFAVRMGELVRKYGERGGRFALIEVGHACQNLALRLSADGLAGYQLGGVLDIELESLLQIGGDRAHVTLGYAIGHAS